MRRFLRSSGLVLYTLLVGLFLAAYAAKYVHPKYLWWIQLVAIFLPYLSALVVLTAIPLLLTRRWVLLALTGVLGLLVAFRFLPGGHRMEAGAVGPGEQLTLLTLNYPSVYAHREDRVQTLSALVNRLRPDIIALQEAWMGFAPNGAFRDARRDVLVLLDSTSYTAVGGAAGGTRDTQTPLLSLFPLEPANYFEVPLDPSGRLNARVARAEGNWRRRTIVVYNVHMQSFGSDKPWREENTSLMDPRVWFRYLRQYREAIQRRASQAELLAQMIRDETDPVIVMGDFNSTSNNWDYTWIAEGLTDAFSAAGVGWGGTYHVGYPFARIDFILLSEDFGVLTASVPNIVVSDHLPVYATVAWKN